MGQGNELPHGAVQRGPLCGHVPLGVGLGVRHLAPSLGVHLGDLGRQRLDSLGYLSTQGLHARVVWLSKGTAGIGAAARQQGAALAVLAQH